MFLNNQSQCQIRVFPPQSTSDRPPSPVYPSLPATPGTPPGQGWWSGPNWAARATCGRFLVFELPLCDKGGFKPLYKWERVWNKCLESRTYLLRVCNEKNPTKIHLTHCVRANVLTHSIRWMSLTHSVVGSWQPWDWSNSCQKSNCRGLEIEGFLPLDANDGLLVDLDI